MLRGLVQIAECGDENENEEGRNGLAGHLYMGGSDLIGGSLIGGGGSLVGGGDSGIGGVVLLLNLS